MHHSSTSLKLKKLFVDGRTGGRTFYTHVIRSTHLAAGVVVAIPFVIGILGIRHVVTASKNTSVTLKHTYTDTHTQTNDHLHITANDTNTAHKPHPGSR